MKNQKYIGNLNELKNADNVMKRGVLVTSSSWHD